MTTSEGTPDDSVMTTSTAEASVLNELVAYLRDRRSELRAEWTRRIADAQLLSVMAPSEISSEVTAVYDNYVDALETGSVETLRPTRATFPNGSSRGASRPTRCSGSSSC